MDEINVGDIVDGKVTGVEEYGIFVTLDDGSSGLIHISEISDSFVRDVSEYAKIGDILKVKVLSIDSYDHYKLSLKAIKSNSHNKKIVETNTGFSNLKKKLDEWIDEFEENS